LPKWYYDEVYDMQLKYYVPFKAQTVDAQLALKERLINIEGVAIDTSVNSNKWQVPEEDLDFFVSSLINAQLRIDHAESALAVIGKVPEAKRLGSTAWFRAEIGDQPIIEKVLRGYLSHVSVQVDSDDVECSKCGKQSRSESMLVHLCPDAWEIVHKPKVRELSIVASPAYKNTEFKPVGFAAAMDENQWAAVMSVVSQSSKNDEDVGPRLKEPQGPENKNESKEVKPLSAQKDGQQQASPHQAQGVVNVAPGEGAPKQVTYDDLTNQVVKLMEQIKSASDADIAELSKRVAEVEAEVAKRATKVGLTRKLTELSKKLSESGADAATATQAKKGEDGDAEDLPSPKQPKGPEQAETAESEAVARPHGKGLISTEELDKEANGPSAPWFKDLLKANALLNKSGRTSFSG
jgi:hypothetical protein